MQELATKNGNQQISERINNDPIALGIVSLINAMRTDYGARFTKQFSDNEILRDFKRRLYKKLCKFDPRAIVEGYENLTENAPKFCPTVPEIVRHVREANIILKRAEREKNKARLISQQKTTYNCDPIKLLAEARVNCKKNINKSELIKIYEEHERLIRPISIQATKNLMSF